MDPITPPYSWKFRRTFMFAVSGFAAALMMVALLVKPDAAISSNIIIGGFALLGSIVGTYVFGAVWDDKNRGV